METFGKMISYLQYCFCLKHQFDLLSQIYRQQGNIILKFSSNYSRVIKTRHKTDENTDFQTLDTTQQFRSLVKFLQSKIEGFLLLFCLLRITQDG